MSLKVKLINWNGQTIINKYRVIACTYNITEICYFEILAKLWWKYVEKNAEKMTFVTDIPMWDVRTFWWGLYTCYAFYIVSYCFKNDFAEFEIHWANLTCIKYWLEPSVSNVQTNVYGLKWNCNNSTLRDPIPYPAGKI